MRILVLEHEPGAPTALLADWAASRDHDLDVVAVPALERWPELSEVDALVSLGSERSIHASPEGWIGEEIEFLRTAHGFEVPILGICFGGQALSRALGGSIGAEEKPEVAWRLISSLDPGLISPGPWFFWHEDLFTLPPGARLLAGTEWRTVAFTAGETGVGVQFHPEVDGDLARYWIELGRAKLESYGLDIAALEAEVERHAPGARAYAFDLFDRIAEWWGVRSPPIALR
ncbi:MAG: type 1 glutamine amidotransferase [Solirubrobacterales bacterium]|nr:type 1 glutamine amidotransferase [Solirubrobacterales bacterium]MBV9799696.1 type 1 glutamine amidotransferase [Solirubrobacterales bacterium]